MMAQNSLHANNIGDKTIYEGMYVYVYKPYSTTSVYIILQKD